jgi:hypothetical protein
VKRRVRQKLGDNEASGQAGGGREAGGRAHI